jgi:hypothetical protein
MEFVFYLIIHHDSENRSDDNKFLTTLILIFWMTALHEINVIVDDDQRYFKKLIENFQKFLISNWRVEVFISFQVDKALERAHPKMLNRGRLMGK